MNTNIYYFFRKDGTNISNDINLIETLCKIHNSLNKWEWDELLGYEPPELHSSPEDRLQFINNVYHKVRYLIDNVGQSAISWYHFKNNLNKSFTDWINFQLEIISDCPRYTKYLKLRHSRVAQIVDKVKGLKGQSLKLLK